MSRADVRAIFGPTGSGKTEVAVELAARLGTEVVNADPAQCYIGLPILTNQPGPEHDAIAPHRMVDIWPMTYEASFVRFAELAHATIDSLVAERGAAVVCGGSGLYLQAALTRLPIADEGGAPDHDPATRVALEADYAEPGGPELLHAELSRLDPRVGARTHVNDRPRIIRALEVARRGESISPDGGSHWDAELRHPTRLTGLAVDRQLLRDRIDARTAAMFDGGLLEEVAAIAGPRGELADTAFSSTARKLHGLEDCLGVLRSDWTQDVALERMATRTKQYAKRQDTWARRWPGLVRMSPEQVCDELAPG